ncbi:MAG TPA: hypothetical protein VJY15_00115 [Candidatus Acidoferrum sp.]|nr:hypothetical protein [Candidatus Acidoferrum sp.]
MTPAPPRRLTSELQRPVLGASRPFPLFQRLLPHESLDPDLAGVRDPDALARLPYAERAAWQSL